MIPYEDLCTALAKWREKNGLPNGASARPPQGLPAQPEASSGNGGTQADASGELIFSASISSGYGEGLPTEEVSPAEPPTALHAPPFDSTPAGETPIMPRTVEDAAVIDEGTVEGPTGLHVAADQQPARDVTNELDLNDFVDDPEDKV